MKKIILAFTLASALSALQIQTAQAPDRLNLESPNYIKSFDKAISKARKSFAYINTNKGIGSGVILSEDGYIATNWHVIDEAEHIKVIINDKEYQAKLLGLNKTYDLALLKIDAKGLSAIKFADSNDVRVGDIAIAIGNPYNLKETITQGIVTGINKPDFEKKSNIYIQTDASINPGNSGGLLINSKGDLIGINTWIFLGDEHNPTYTQYIAQGFAIPSNNIKKIIQEILNQTPEEHFEYGIRFLDEFETRVFFEGKVGLVISKISKNSGFYKAGLRRGDFLRSIDGKFVDSTSDVYSILHNKKEGESVKITYERDSKSKNAEFVIQTKNITTNKSQKLYDMQLIDIAEDIDLDIPQGVYVDHIYHNSRFFNTALSVGDIIVGIASTEIKNISDFKKAMQKQKEGKRLQIWVKRSNGLELLML